MKKTAFGRNSFAKRYNQLMVYRAIITKSGIDEKIRKKWNLEKLITSTKDLEDWKNTNSNNYEGFWRDIKRVTKYLHLPSDRVEMVGAIIGYETLFIQNNVIQTKFRINKTTKEKELWVKINKTTSINDFRDNWRNVIEPKQQQLEDKIINPNNFWLDEKIFKLKEKGFSYTEITNMFDKEASLTVDTINNACNRYKKLMNLGKKVFGMF